MGCFIRWRWIKQDKPYTDFGALYASVKNEGKSMGMLIEQTAHSGRLVPIATMVIPMIIDGTLSCFATEELPSTK